MPSSKYAHNPEISCAPVRSSPVVSSIFRAQSRYLVLDVRAREIASVPLFKKDKNGQSIDSDGERILRQWEHSRPQHLAPLLQPFDRREHRNDFICPNGATNELIASNAAVCRVGYGSDEDIGHARARGEDQAPRNDSNAQTNAIYSEGHAGVSERLNVIVRCDWIDIGAGTFEIGAIGSDGVLGVLGAPDFARRTLTRRIAPAFGLYE